MYDLFIISIIVGLIILGVLISFAWRWASRQWELPCPVWLSWLLELENPFTDANHANTIIRQLNLQPGMKVLDAGCGPGRLTIPIAQKVGLNGQVLAMDIQSGMLQIVEKKTQEANLPNIQFLQAGIGEGKIQRHYYDRALLVTVLGEIPDQKSALKEIYNALKPGGILSVTETIFDPHYQNKDLVRQLSQNVGFQEKSVIGNRCAYTMLLQKPT